MRWASVAPGRQLIQREGDCIDGMLADLFGYYLLQVGWGREFVDSVAHGRIRHHLILENDFPGMGGDFSIIADDRAFPVASDSLDVVFLPHTLDFSADPHAVLRETERVLIPEGRVILLGFNPWSFWGLWRQLRRNSAQVPWRGNFLRAGRVLDWLNLLGFDVELEEPVMFSPPFRTESMLRRCEWFEPWLRKWLPGISVVYAIRAVKRVSTLTPLQPAWNKRSRLLAGHSVEPTARRPFC